MLKLNNAENGMIFIEIKKAVLSIEGQEQILNKKIISLCRCNVSSKNLIAMTLINAVNLMVICS